MMENDVAPKGGAFLGEETKAILTPESLSAEARLMAKTMEEFVRKEVLPVGARLEAQEPGLMESLLRQAGQLGLAAGSVPETYDGLNLPKSALALLAEKSALDLSFAVSLGVHSGVATLPLLYCGTSEQKRAYLPKLASGDWIGAFALSESDSGSDALAAQTKATLSPDGTHYLLNGAKMWITNGGFADLFTVFAKVDGALFTAFLVPRDTPGLALGREEHKLGLHGSSTRRLLLQDARVPVANVLGEIGKGHRPALCALNLGRFSIGATALGCCKETLRLATLYAKQRVQFGRPIAQFGLIQHKLAEMALRTFLLESMIYRLAGYWDARFAGIAADAPDSGERYIAAAEEYAIESAIIKFVGTETMGYVVDETLQIHGGFGYSEEFPIARLYRDARVFRIFEGTNEINRLTVVDQLLKRLQRGRLTLPALTPNLFPNNRGGENSAEGSADAAVTSLRRIVLELLSACRETLGEELMRQQEIVGITTDRIAALFALESAWLRSRQLSGAAAALAQIVVQVYGSEAGAQAEQQARVVCAALGREETNLAFDRLPQPDTLALRRQIAEAVLARDGYPW